MRNARRTAALNRARLAQELRLIGAGVLQEFLRLVGCAWLLPRPRPAARLVGSTLVDACGRTVRVIGRDPRASGRYVAQREDGELFTLGRATILRRRT
jgi:hypothetical protein